MGSGSTHSAQAINKKEITKINKCIKDNNAEPFFKCLKCSILSAKTFGIDIIQFIRQPTKLVSCKSQRENHTYLTLLNNNWSFKTNSLIIRPIISGIGRPKHNLAITTRKWHQLHRKPTCVQKKADIRHKQSVSGLEKLPRRPKYSINW